MSASCITCTAARPVWSYPPPGAFGMIINRSRLSSPRVTPQPAVTSAAATTVTVTRVHADAPMRIHAAGSSTDVERLVEVRVAVRADAYAE